MQSLLQTRDGRLWFPTTPGVVVADPHVPVENDQPPPVVTERIVADQEVLSDTVIAATGTNAALNWKLGPGRARVLAAIASASRDMVENIRELVWAAGYGERLASGAA